MSILATAVMKGVLFIFLYISTIVLHELGHYAMAGMFEKKFKSISIRRKRKWWKSLISFEIIIDTEQLSDKQYRAVLVGGILLGLIPLVPMSVNKYFITFDVFMLFILYIIGCLPDLKQLLKRRNG